MHIIKTLGPAIFFCTLIICFEIFYHKKKDESRREASKRKFWERENAANSVRRKDLTFLNYINIPVESLPITETTDEEILDYQELIKKLSGKRILNLSGMSNTDLKEEYGPANLPDLTEYDENYIKLVNTLAKWGERLIAIGETQNAIKVLEYGISINTDVSRNYFLLADQYRKANEPDKIDGLIDHAQRLDSIMKKAIIKKLTEIRGYLD